MFVPKMPKKVLLVTTSPAGLSGPGVTVNVLKQHMESSKKYVAEVVSFNGGGVAQEGVVGDIKFETEEPNRQNSGRNSEWEMK